jgi:hypothetical protein
MILGVRYHGGQCCGMTHISGFPESPATTCGAVLAKTVAEIQEYNARQRTDYYGVPRWHARPEESAGDRLKALIRCITHGDPGSIYSSGRTRGCIEVTLIDSQLLNWGEFLEGLGFKKVNSFINSNSHRRVHVLHLNTGQ